jgi:ssDNA-binding Zn-finger/Zn-ribbon topoisomerase 1
LVCDRQFVWPITRKPIPHRPHCPSCGRAMHVYARASKVIRFRCPDYPRCHNYSQVTIENNK